MVYCIRNSLASDTMKKITSRESLFDYLIQFVFIFSSVYFAFWLTKQGEVGKIKQIERKAVQAVYIELQKNIVQLQKATAFHEQIRDKLFLYADSIEKGTIDAQAVKPNDHLQKVFTRKSNSLGFPNVERNAWETLKSSEAYVYLDYELASSLGKLYDTQKTGVESTMTTIITDIFSAKELFKKEESETIVWLAAWSFRELEGQEQYLMIASQETLKQLENHYPTLTREQ